MPSYDEILEREQRFLLPTYLRYPLAIEWGKGVFVYDADGRRYLDFVGGLGVNALGHAHPRIVKAIRDQAAKVIHTSNLYFHEYQGRLAEKLCRLSGLGRVFFSNSGTEAIEGGLKLARAAGHAAGGDAKCKLVALEGSYHGRTFGAMSLTGQAKYRQDFEPLLPGVDFVQLNDIDGLRRLVDAETCAVVLEPIQGEGGVRECSQEFLQEARALCDRYQAVLILDEIQCGLGRTGKMFAFEHYGIVPDVVCVAKPIAGGLPLGAFIVREELGRSIPPGKHGTTFGGGPLATRVALEYFSILEDENLLDHVTAVGGYLQEQLAAIVEDSPKAVNSRGRGLMQALELNVPARPFVEAAMQEGVLFNSTQEVVLRFLPPFLLEKQHVDKGMHVLRKLLRKRAI